MKTYVGIFMLVLLGNLGAMEQGKDLAQTSGEPCYEALYPKMRNLYYLASVCSFLRFDIQLCTHGVSLRGCQDRTVAVPIHRSLSVMDHTQRIDYFLRLLGKGLLQHDILGGPQCYADCCFGIADALISAVDEVVIDGHIAQLDFVRKHIAYERLQYYMSRCAKSVGDVECPDFAALLQRELFPDLLALAPVLTPGSCYSSREMMYLMLVVSIDLLRQVQALGDTAMISVDVDRLRKLETKIAAVKQQLDVVR